MKRILFVMFDFPPRKGGAQQYNWDMVRALPPDRSVILAPRWDGWEEFDRASGYQTYRVPDGTMEKLTIPLLPFLLPYVIVRESISEVWFSKYSRILPLGATAACRTLGIPFGLSVFGEDLACAAQDFGINCPGIAARLRDRTLRRASQIVANSRFSGSLLPTGTTFTVIHPCLPEMLGAFPVLLEESPRRAESPRRFTILSVGSLIQRKGFDLVIRAVAKGLGVPLRYVIAGTGPEEAYLKQLARELKADHLVEFAGRVSEEEKRCLYRTADLFVMPSRLEGFGIVFLEAGSYGLCSVGSRTGGIPEAVEDGRTGILVRSDNLDQLHRALLLLATDSTLRSRLGRAAYERSLNHFCWERFADRWTSVLRPS